MHYLVVEDMTIWLKLGGPSTPAVGFAAGIERLLIESLMDDKNETMDFFIGFGSHSESAIKIANQLIDDGYSFILIL